MRVGLSFGSSSGSLLLLHDLVTGLLTFAFPINLNCASGSGLSGTGRDSKQATVIFQTRPLGSEAGQYLNFCHLGWRSEQDVHQDDDRRQRSDDLQNDAGMRTLHIATFIISGSIVSLVDD